MSTNQTSTLAAEISPPIVNGASRPKLIVLVAEDSSDDLSLIRLAFRKSGLHVSVYHVEDGEDATHYLSGSYGYYNRRKFPLPDVLLSDVQMPRMNGMELLKWLKATKTFDQLPAILMSGSMEPAFAKRALAMGATEFVHKDTLSAQPLSLIDAVKRCCPKW